MAGDLNRATLVGRLGKDPETSSLQNGDKVVKFSVATSETWRDKQTGERRERTQWHNVVIWNVGLGNVAQDYLRKGSRVLIEGAIETREWEKNGEKRYSTEVVLRNFDSKLILLGGKSDGDSRRESRDDDRSSRPSSSKQSHRDDLDDEIPF